jgi:hypothetical protein
MDRLQISKRRTNRLMAQLAGEGYIEPHPEQADGLDRWHLTVKGRALSYASAAPPIRRRTADRIVRELLDRIDAINANDELVYVVTEAVVFGSYLTDTQQLSDVDIGFRLARRRPEARPREETKRRVAIARQRGREFRSWSEQFSWAYTEILLLLKSRSRGLSLHDMEDDGIFEGELPCRTLYKGGRRL